MEPLPFLTADLPGIGGVLRARDEDFVVDEVPAYPASGAGDHVFVRIEKRGLTTPAAVDAIAAAVGVPARDVGVAGMKDRHAVTRQWLSLPPRTTPEQALALAVPGVVVLEAIRHGHKLRTGHVRGNRFALRVRDLALPAAAAADRARAILAVLAGVPGALNWYGEQRFGRDGDNAARGRALLTGEAPRGRRDRRMDRLMISALQSELFNAWLRARLTDGLYRRALAGDVLHKAGGGLFTCTEPEVDTARLAAGEVVLTGPMFGDAMRAAPPDTEAGAREAAILAAAGIAPGAFHAVRAIAEGTRRDAAITVGAPEVTAEPDAIVVTFTLPGGAYATAVMREVMKGEPAGAPSEA